MVCYVKSWINLAAICASAFISNVEGKAMVEHDKNLRAVVPSSNRELYGGGGEEGGNDVMPQEDTSMCSPSVFTYAICPEVIEPEVLWTSTQCLDWTRENLPSNVGFEDIGTQQCNLEPKGCFYSVRSNKVIWNEPCISGIDRDRAVARCYDNGNKVRIYCELEIEVEETPMPTPPPTPPPTPEPTPDPTPEPTPPPTPEPTPDPTPEPTPPPSLSPSLNPTLSPSLNPTLSPTESETVEQAEASLSPTKEPTWQDDGFSAEDETRAPTNEPSWIGDDWVDDEA